MRTAEGKEQKNAWLSGNISHISTGHLLNDIACLTPVRTYEHGSYDRNARCSGKWYQYYPVVGRSMLLIMNVNRYRFELESRKEKEAFLKSLDINWKVVSFGKG